MTLDQFKDKTASMLESFHAFWKAGGKEDPELFPESMGQSDWFEQLIFHMEKLDKESVGK